MLSDNQILKIKIKLVKNNLKPVNLAEQLNVSKTTMSLILNKKQDFPRIEKELKEWLIEKI